MDGQVSLKVIVATRVIILLPIIDYVRSKYLVSFVSFKPFISESINLVCFASKRSANSNFTHMNHQAC